MRINRRTIKALIYAVSGGMFISIISQIVIWITANTIADAMMSSSMWPYVLVALCVLLTLPAFFGILVSIALFTWMQKRRVQVKCAMRGGTDLEYTDTRRDLNSAGSATHEDDNRPLLAYWKLPVVLILLRTIGFTVFYIVCERHGIKITGPGADADAMIWLAWACIDFPIGFLAVFLSTAASTNIGAVLTLYIFGSIQWYIWGLLLTLVIRKIQVWRRGRIKRQSQ